jgi:hypothetical protein
MAPIQFLSHDYDFINFATLDIEGGTVLLYEKNRKRYLITAWHIWDCFTNEMSDENVGRRHGAFVGFDGGKLMPLPKDLCPYYLDKTLDILVLTPDWISDSLPGREFFQGDVVPASEGNVVCTWGYPKTARTVTSEEVYCEWRELHGNATAPCDDSFKFVPSPPTSDALGGFSGAPVFRDDGKLLGIVSEGGSSFGIVKCSELLSAIDKL